MDIFSATWISIFFLYSSSCVCGCFVCVIFSFSLGFCVCVCVYFCFILIPEKNESFIFPEFSFSSLAKNKKCEKFLFNFSWKFEFFCFENETLQHLKHRQQEIMNGLGCSRNIYKNMEWNYLYSHKKIWGVNINYHRYSFINFLE